LGPASVLCNFFQVFYELEIVPAARLSQKYLIQFDRRQYAFF
jgi:hypothetical protein